MAAAPRLPAERWAADCCHVGATAVRHGAVGRAVHRQLRQRLDVVLLAPYFEILPQACSGMLGIKEQGVNFQVGLAYYYELGRGPIAGDTTGMFKLIFHAETLEVLAVHIIGSNATELVHIGQLAIDFHARVNYFINQVFNYPTFAEGYRIAALNGLNKLDDRHKVSALG